MRKAQQEGSESGGSSQNSDEDEGSTQREYGEEGEMEDGDFDEDYGAYDGDEAEEEGEFDEEDFDGQEVDAEGEEDFQGEPDEQGEDMYDSFDEDDGRQDRRQRGSKVGRDKRKTSQKETDRNSDDSESSGDHSRSSFDDLRSKNMKMLQSSIQNKELPLRIAYEQLDELAANAEKVKSAIEKNRAMLNIQVRKSNSRYLRAAFAAWKLDLDWQKAKRRDIIRANAWRRRFLLARAFRAWVKDHMAQAKLRRLQKSATIIIQRHNMRRCWKAWIALIKEKLREQDEHRKEKRLVKDLDSKYQEQICRRACNFMYRYRLRRIFSGFRDGCKVSRLQDRWEDGIQRHLAKKKLKRLFQAWKRQIQESNYLQAFLQGRLRKRNLWKFFKAWQSFVGDARSRAMNLQGLSRKSSTNKLGDAFAAWAALVREKKANGEKLKRATSSAEMKMWKNAFDAFVDGCLESKRQGNIQRRAFKRLQTWRLNKAFQAWICYMQIQAQKKMARLQENIVTVEKENDRLRVENDRLAHVIDSGNWGKERISELIQAGQVLTGERDALTRLLGRMQRQHSFALDQQRKHEEEVQELKRQLMGKKHLVRNKLLVKGASSFNSLIKAMKEDVLKNGNDPELLYTIDRLAMDEVTVFPDGDLSVKSMPNFERGKGNWSRHSSPQLRSQAELSPQPIQQAPTAPAIPSTPPTKSFRARTPIKARVSDKEIFSQSSPSSKPSLGTPRHVSTKTPIRGRPIDHFDYDQKIRSSDQEESHGIHGADQEVVVEGPHIRDTGVVKRYPYRYIPTPTS